MEREFYPIRYRQSRCCNGERVPAVSWAANAIRVCWTAFPHDDVAHAVGDSDTWSDRAAAGLPKPALEGPPRRRPLDRMPVIA